VATLVLKIASVRSSAPPCADECRQVILDIVAVRGVEAHVTWAPPLFPTGYEPLNMSCPHGVPWFMEPTTEQRIRYAQEGTA